MAVFLWQLTLGLFLSEASLVKEGLRERERTELGGTGITDSDIDLCPPTIFDAFPLTTRSPLRSDGTPKRGGWRVLRAALGPRDLWPLGGGANERDVI